MAVSRSCHSMMRMRMRSPSGGGVRARGITCAGGLLEANQCRADREHNLHQHTYVSIHLHVLSLVYKT